MSEKSKGNSIETYNETLVGEMEIPCGIKGSFTVQTLMGHQVGHVPENIPAHLALVDDVTLTLQHASHLWSVIFRL